MQYIVCQSYLNIRYNIMWRNKKLLGFEVSFGEKKPLEKKI